MLRCMLQYSLYYSSTSWTMSINMAKFENEIKVMSMVLREDPFCEKISNLHISFIFSQIR